MKTQCSPYFRTAIFLIFSFLFTNSFAQWPQWRGPLPDGFSKEANLLNLWPAEGPRLVWSADGLGDGFSSTEIQNKMVYTSGKRDSVEILTALDLSGKVKWSTT